jgi:hypothetical protein
MKKLIIITVALGLCAVSAFAQGQISFGNGNSDLVITNSVNANPAAASTSNYKVQLFYQPGSNPAPAPIYDSSITGNLGSWEAMSGSPVVSIFPIAGKFAGGAETTGTDVAPNGSVWLEVIGWSGGYASFSAALQAGAPSVQFGFSAVWTQNSGSGAPGNPATITGAGQFPGLLIENLPEPSFVALSGLGAAGLLLFRRKK